MVKSSKIIVNKYAKEVILSSIFPDKTYRKSVKPLAGLFIITALMQFLAVQAFPLDIINTLQIPLIHTAIAKLYVVRFVNFILVFIGVGLYKKWKIAWYSLFGYITIGTLWAIDGIVDGYFSLSSSKIVDISLLIIAIAVTALGLYLATKDAFVYKPKEEKVDDQKSRVVQK